MARLRLSITMSLDGYVAGPNQSVENPLGEGGTALHEWVFAVADVPRDARHGGRRSGVDDQARRRIAREHRGDDHGPEHVRRRAGPVAARTRWNGWWGDDPPYHTPVFVLTHHAREPLAMQGGTTFHFVTEGIEAALGRALRGGGGQGRRPRWWRRRRPAVPRRPASSTRWRSTWFPFCWAGDPACSSTPRAARPASSAFASSAHRRSATSSTAARALADAAAGAGTFLAQLNILVPSCCGRQDSSERPRGAVLRSARAGPRRRRGARRLRGVPGRPAAAARARRPAPRRPELRPAARAGGARARARPAPPGSSPSRRA